MDEAEARWPNRCLPLLVANQSGWWLLNPDPFTATWDGGPGQDAVCIEYDEEQPERLAMSHFGYGIITFTVPFLFRTDPGWDLLARGPANLPKDGLSALEGVVETDWSTATFAMSWKITRPGVPVRFERGEPYCTVVPQRRYELESFTPRVANLDEDQELAAGFRAWLSHRDRLHALKFVSQFGKVEGFEANAWQRDYFKGQDVAGNPAPDHRTKRELRPFSA
jgi:hypothetical protein